MDSYHNCSASYQTAVSGSALFGYRFKITSNQDGSTLGTGFMTSSKPLDKTEQKDLFHNWTHGKYLKSENYVSIQFQKQIKDEHRTTLSK